ncbi:hypothetical protein SKAU_G00001160 [Synaphobranchus kaupii]|uniref:Uncharacterized protein n=1 Tax=Synaphobranchus kaupii TaxID=118154 RepID=A0A9Q1G980_SYNKA|nr:hypothetical protein SKAU_G00001160 [Synaphobranchus kaupii]
MGSLFRSEEMCLAQLFLLSLGLGFMTASVNWEKWVWSNSETSTPLSTPSSASLSVRSRGVRKWTGFWVTCYGRSRRQTSPLPEGDVNPVAPLPKHVMVIMEQLQRLEVELSEVTRNKEKLQKNLLELT